MNTRKNAIDEQCVFQSYPYVSSFDDQYLLTPLHLKSSVSSPVISSKYQESINNQYKRLIAGSLISAFSVAALCFVGDRLATQDQTGAVNTVTNSTNFRNSWWKSFWLAQMHGGIKNVTLTNQKHIKEKVHSALNEDPMVEDHINIKRDLLTASIVAFIDTFCTQPIATYRVLNDMKILLNQLSDNVAKTLSQGIHLRGAASIINTALYISGISANNALAAKNKDVARFAALPVTVATALASGVLTNSLGILYKIKLRNFCIDLNPSLAQSFNIPKDRYKGTSTTKIVKDIYRHEGIKGFLKGVKYTTGNTVIAFTTLFVVGKCLNEYLFPAFLPISSDQPKVKLPEPRALTKFETQPAKLFNPKATRPFHNAAFALSNTKRKALAQNSFFSASKAFGLPHQIVNVQSAAQHDAHFVNSTTFFHLPKLQFAKSDNLAVSTTPAVKVR